MSLYAKAKKVFEKYDRHISTLTLIGGFTLDNLLFSSVDSLGSHIVFIIYLLIASIGIVVINFHEGGFLKHSFFATIKPFTAAVVQFVFGGLFSVFFVFYSRSGSFMQSWPFLLFLLGMLIGNEFLRAKYTRLVFQVSIFFILLFSYLIFLVPLITKSISTLMFVISGILSLAVVAIFIRVLYIFVPERVRDTRKQIRISIILIYIFINVLYFTNIIPPIPLALKESGVYHTIEKQNGGYLLSGELTSWYAKYIGTEVYHSYQGEPVYVWSSIFAPTKLTISVIHEWQYYNETLEKWVTVATVPFHISGGRDNGYRGYSVKLNTFEGKWRVTIKTSNNRIIGREAFTIVYDGQKRPLEMIEK